MKNNANKKVNKKVNKKSGYFPKMNVRIYEPKYYIIGYVIGYIVSLLVTGIPSLIYLEPVKIDALMIGYLVGLILGQPPTEKKWTVSDIHSYSMTPSLVAVTSMLLVGIIAQLLQYFGILASVDPVYGIIAKLTQ